MSLEIRDLTHIYAQGTAFEFKALDHVNLIISDGDFLAIAGHTGSGKSTLVQHLNGLLRPTSGSVLLNGQDINGAGVNRRALRQRVGLVFQYPEYQLFEETVAKDVAFGPANQGVTGEALNDRVRRALKAVHLDYNTIGQRSPFELSGGQMRRVAIAGVIAMEPEILVLDEPTAGLDPQGRDSILAMIGELHQKGTTVVMISHSMDDMARLATHMAVMQHGKIIACDTPRAIFAQPSMLRQAGLDIPEAARLCESLRSRGIGLPNDLYTPDELCAHLLRLWKEAQA